MTAPAGTLSPPAAIGGVQLAFGRLSIALLMAGAFCCSIDWSISPAGFRVALCDAFFFAAMLCQAPWVMQNLARLGGVPLLPVIGASLFAVSALVDAEVGHSMSDPLNAVKLVLSLMALPVLLLVAVGEDWRRLDAVLAAWLAGATLSAVVAVTSRYNIPFFGLLDPVSAAGGRALGLSYFANELGYTSALNAPVAAYFFFRYRYWGIRLVMVAAVGVLLYAIHLSGSRSSLLAVACSVAVLSIRLIQWSRLPGMMVTILGLLAGATLVYAIAQELELPLAHGIEESAIGRMLGLSPTGEGSTASRKDYAWYAWDQFLESPYFGKGYAYLRAAHFHVLALLHSGGLLAFTAFTTWLVGILATCSRVGHGIGRTIIGRHRLLWPTAIAGLVVWFTNGAFQPLLADRNGYILVGVLLVLDAGVRRAMHYGQPIVSPPGDLQARTP